MLLCFTGSKNNQSKPETSTEEKVLIYKVTFDGTWNIFNHLDSALDEAKSLIEKWPEDEPVVTVSAEYMTKEDYNNLPEFMGW